MSTIILNNTFKTMMPLINAIVIKTLQQFFSTQWLPVASVFPLLNFRPW